MSFHDQEAQNGQSALQAAFARQRVAPQALDQLTDVQLDILARQIGHMAQEAGWASLLSGEPLSIGGKTYDVLEALFLPIGHIFERKDAVATRLRQRYHTRIGHLVALGFEGVHAIDGISPKRAGYIQGALSAIGLGLFPIPQEHLGYYKAPSHKPLPVHSAYAALMFPLAKLILETGKYQLECSKLSPSIRLTDHLLDVPLAALTNKILPQVRTYAGAPATYPTTDYQQQVSRGFARRLLEIAGFVDNLRAAQ